MLYGISLELGLALKAQGVPFPVVFGPEPTKSLTAAHERVVVEQPIDEKRDQAAPAKATHPNPFMPMIRVQGARLRIFARSNLPGAAWHDHTERAEKVLDHVLAELDQVVRASKNTLTTGAGGFVSLVDANGSSSWPGAVYEFDFAVDRGVFRRTWAGEAADEVIVGTDVTIVNTTKVSAAGGAAGTPPDNAETASGG